MKCSRRQILVGFFGLAAAGTAAGSWLWRRKLAASLKAPVSIPVASPFSAAEQRTLLAAVERALPGAVEAGAPDHMSYWMTRDRYFSNFQNEFRVGLQQLDRVARELHGKLFAGCNAGQQDEVFKRFASGEVKLAGFDGARFFEHLVTLTLEGFLADPKYGGNRNQVGWKFVGYKPCWWTARLPDQSGAQNSTHQAH